MLNLKQLRYFCEVVNSGNARTAAGKLFVPMLLGAAFAEAIAIYSLVVVFTL